MSIFEELLLSNKCLQKVVRNREDLMYLIGEEHMLQFQLDFNTHSMKKLINGWSGTDVC
jgi:hypothetical protein